MKDVIQTILSDIREYMLLVKKNYKLQLSICDAQEELFPYISSLAPLNAHDNFYCSLLKKDPRIQKRCVFQQVKEREAQPEAVFYERTCYAGLSEYLFKVYHHKKYLAFISVGAYCLDKEKSKEKIQEIAEGYGFDEQILVEVFENTVDKSTRVNPRKVEPLVRALARMIELLYVTLKQHDDAQKNETLFGHIINYITENYMNDITIEDIARAVNYSSYYISHVFRSIKNCSIMFFVNDLRIQKAKELLENTDFSITKIAYMVGYNDSNYFSSIFQKRSGIPPSVYRKTAKTKAT